MERAWGCGYDACKAGSRPPHDAAASGTGNDNRQHDSSSSPPRNVGPEPIELVRAVSPASVWGVDEQPGRTSLELVTIAVFGVAYVAFAVAFFVGLPALAIVRALDHGATLAGVLWATFAALFLGTAAYGLIRDREARGWILFALLGWLTLVPAVGGRLRRLVRQRG